MSSPPPSSSHPPPPHSDVPAVLSPAEITAALRDLTTAVQEIRLFLAGPYGPLLPAALLSWQPTHQAASAAIAGPLLLSSPPPDAGLLQSPLPLSTISGPSPTSAPGVPLLQQPAAFFPTGTLQQQQLLPPPPTPPLQLLSSPTLSLPFGGKLQQQQQLPSRPTPQQRLLPPPTPSLPFGGVGATLALGSTSTPPGMPFHQVCFPPSPSPLPAWIALRHVSAAVRLQAAARGLLVRRRVREMRDLQL
nr:extensin-like [Lolium perenne]